MPSLVLLRFFRIYQTTIKSLIPLPDENASPGDAAHVSHYPIHPAGSTVLGLYPDTSCFYQATVVASPKDPQPGGRVGFHLHWRGAGIDLNVSL